VARVSAVSVASADEWLDLLHDRAHDAYIVGQNGLLRVPVHRFREWAFRAIAMNELGRDATLERSIRLTTRRGVSVGAHSIINRDVTLDGRGGLWIGAWVNISPEALLLSSEHDPQSPVFADRNRATVVGDRAWISSRAILLPGATVGEGAIVAAGAVVHGPVAPWSIVAGNPAKEIGQRSPQAQATLASPYRRLFH
jgi:maltose O-acetyltransferase